VVPPDQSTVRGLPTGWYGPTKRLFDAGLAAIGLVVLSPVLLLTAGLIRVDSPGPAIFRQRRIGRGSREFTIYKFRTMHLGTPEVAPRLLTDSHRRVTRVGRILRRTSLDELPQLVNILRGEMSIVGPRPALYNQDDLIRLRREAGVDRLRPGVTGLAQVRGRDELDVPEKVAFDIRYMETCSVATDFRIIGATFVALVSGRGTN
jgi:O-antigen biosynthesis protein WbqP